MIASSRTRAISVLILTAFILIPALQIPSSSAEGALTISYEYNFSEPYVKTDTSERLYSIPGLELDERGGVPALPVRSIFLAVPLGYVLKDIEVRCASPRTIELFERYPINPAELALNGELSFSYDYQCRPYEVTTGYMLEGVELIGLELRPLCWDEGSATLSFISCLTIEITCEQSTIDHIGDLDRVRDLVDNPQVVPDLHRSTTSNVLPAGDYDHIIITSQELTPPFLELAEWKGQRNELGSFHQNIRSTVVSLDHILGNSHFWGDPISHGRTGNDTQTIIRNFIIAAYQEWGVKYVLLGGDVDVIPVRMLDAPMYDVKYDELPGDIYYSGLDGDWDTDGNGVYGELSGILIRDEADLLAEVFVGRATVSTVKQAWNFVNKTIAYEMGFSNQYGYDLVLIGEQLSADPSDYSDNGTFGDAYKEEVYQQVLADEGLDCLRLYEDKNSFSASAVLTAMDSDVHVINHMGHGNFEYLAGLDNYDVQGLDNIIPFILYTQACMVAGFDEKSYSPGDCIAEEFVQGAGGTVAFIGNSRYGWYSPGNTAGSSQKFDISFFSQVYDDDVTDLGRALSYSKEEWATSASSLGSVRWVYLELNLLGDPETRVHTLGRATHDLAVLDIGIDRPMLGERCPITVRVQNLGQSDDHGTFRLLVDGAEVGSVPVSLGPGESITIPMEWTPTVLTTVNITAQIICVEDQRSENDQLAVYRMVDRRVVTDETWTGNMTLTGGLLIDPLVTVDVMNCNITLQPSDMPYRFTVLGAFSLNGSTVQGSPFFMDLVGGDLEIISSRLVGMSTESVSILSDGSLYVEDAKIEGGHGWRLDGTLAIMHNVTLIDQTGEWSLSNSSTDLYRLAGHGGDGLHLRNMSGAVTSSSWTDGSSGLSIEMCSSMTLHDLTFQGNEMDMGIFGDARVNFEHDLKNVSLTHGPLRILYGLDGETVENATGSLYLVGCHDILVRSSRFLSSGNGLALVDSSEVEMAGNAFENCTIGLLVIDSDGLAWGNDLLFNDRPVSLVRSNITFGKDHPVGGNHYSEMTGTDVMNGEGQDLIGADGIFDAPYDEGDVFDRYPKVMKCSLVHDLPGASFVLGASQANRVDVLRLASDSHSGIGIANWTWDMGDGTYAYGESATHTYGSLGAMKVNLTIVDHYGRRDSAEAMVQVVNLDPLCDLGITPEDPAPGETVQFHDLSMDRDGHVVSWHWDFGDGNISDLPSPEHAFVEEDDYLVSLTVHDADGGSDTASRLLAVGNDPPVASFTWNPTSVTTLVEVQFISLSSDPDGELMSWTWDFGDGSLGSGQTVKHKYTGLGTYTVTLLVTDEDGAGASSSKSLTVRNSRPVASFQAPAEVVSLLEAQFVDRSYDLDGSVIGWSWNFGDGGTSDQMSPWYAFRNPGTYQVSLTVTDDRGWMGTTTSSITVLNRPPQVNMTVPQGELWSLEILDFNASGDDPDGAVAAFFWDMGDGDLMEGENVTHAYLAPGNYTVTVTCKDDFGGENSASSSITILNLNPRAEVRVDHGEHPLELALTAQAEDDDGSIASYDWNFGDGTFGNGATVRHRYQDDGSYEVTLTVVDDAGGSVETRTLVTVNLASISLTNPELRYDADRGWTVSVDLVNEGAIPVGVTLLVDAGGTRFLTERNISGLSSIHVDLELANFKAGNITVKVLSPDGWDSDLQDNVWAAKAEIAEPFPYWLVGLGILAIGVVVAVLLVRRR